jgi:hypothetical protein
MMAEWAATSAWPGPRGAVALSSLREAPEDPGGRGYDHSVSLARVRGRAETASTDVAALARSCHLVVTARQLAGWVGPDGRRVTPSGVLRPAEVPEAAAVLGLRVKPPVRRAADFPPVHRGWLMAVATGMIQVASGRATATGEPSMDEAPVDGVTAGAARADEAVLAGWLDGVRSICAELSDRRFLEMVQWLVLLVLEALLDDGPDEQLPHELAGYQVYRRVQQALIDQDTLREAVDESRWANWLVPQTPHGTDWRLFDLLSDAGAVQGTPSAPRVTALGRLLAERLRELAPFQIRADWSPTAVLDRLAVAGHDADPWRLPSTGAGPGTRWTPLGNSWVRRPTPTRPPAVPPSGWSPRTAKRHCRPGGRHCTADSWLRTPAGCCPGGTRAPGHGPATTSGWPWNGPPPPYERRPRRSTVLPG